MSTSARKRSKILGLLCVMVLSSTLMLWMFWHFPLATSIATFIVLTALGLSARLARWVDTDLSEMEHRRKQQV
jgi:CHASE2 domain-containing sensor protein